MEQLTPRQKEGIANAMQLILKAAHIITEIDKEIQSESSTGPNPVNHTADDLENTASYIASWIQHGVDLS